MDRLKENVTLVVCLVIIIHETKNRWTFLLTNRFLISADELYDNREE